MICTERPKVNHDKAYSVPLCARKLGVDRRTVYRYMKRGLLPFVYADDGVHRLVPGHAIDEAWRRKSFKPKMPELWSKYRHVKMYAAVCSRCGAVCEACVSDMEQLLDAAQVVDWREIDGDLYCPQCYEVDSDSDEYQVLSPIKRCTDRYKGMMDTQVLLSKVAEMRHYQREWAQCRLKSSRDKARRLEGEVDAMLAEIPGLKYAGAQRRPAVDLPTLF